MKHAAHGEKDFFPTRAISSAVRAVSGPSPKRWRSSARTCSSMTKQSFNKRSRAGMETRKGSRL